MENRNTIQEFEFKEIKTLIRINERAFKNLRDVRGAKDRVKIEARGEAMRRLERYYALLNSRVADSRKAFIFIQYPSKFNRYDGV